MNRTMFERANFKRKRKAVAIEGGEGVKDMIGGGEKEAMLTVFSDDEIEE